MGYCDNADVAHKYDDVLPSAHTHVALRQFPLENVHYLVPVLHDLHPVSDEDQ